MGERSRRPQPPHSPGGIRPRSGTFYRGCRHQLAGFRDTMGLAFLQQFPNLPSTFPWTPGPTLPTEPVALCYVWRPSALPLFPLYIVPASYGLARNQRGPWRPFPVPELQRPSASQGPSSRLSPGASPQAGQVAEAVRFHAHRVWTRPSPHACEVPQGCPSSEEQRLDLVLLRLAEAATSLALSQPVTNTQQEVSRSGRRLVYSAELLRSLNAQDSASSPSSCSDQRIERPLATPRVSVGSRLPRSHFGPGRAPQTALQASSTRVPHSTAADAATDFLV